MVHFVYCVFSLESSVGEIRINSTNCTKLHSHCGKQAKPLLPPINKSDEHRIKLAQKREAIRSHSDYCCENQDQETKNIIIETKYFLGRKSITRQYRDSNVKPHREKTIDKWILQEPPKRGVHSNIYSREQIMTKGNRNQTTYKGVV